MVEKSKLDEDKEGKADDPSHYRGMIGTLLYLIASRPDLQFAICMCARYQARPTEKHLHAIKSNWGLWYPKDSLITLTEFADADHTGCQDTCRSTSEYQLAVIFTKALGRERIEFLINKLGMQSFTSKTLKQLTDEVDETIDMTIDQQVGLDEALVPHASRLRIGKNVPKIYMQEFWATTTVHHHSIRFEMNNKKRIINLEYFIEMLQISHRILNQQFDELPFEEEILAFLRELGHNG
nr:hypothetical protein [Tanacetum cinerariifolium]GEZ36645.1 hypothetical protein [Tanacetum cinerariifolium]